MNISKPDEILGTRSTSGIKEIKFLDLYKINKPFEEEFTASFKKFLNTGWYILGESVMQFESAYANFSNTQYCIGVANGRRADTQS